MLSYRILAPGRRSQDPLREAADDYAQRLGRYAKVELVRLKESDPAQEAQAMLSALQPQEYVVALDERGQQGTTMQLHDTLLALDARGQGRIVWLIGGADGLGAEAKKRAQSTWGLSRLTLPHRAALVLLTEQLYRVHTIIRREKYHRI